MLATKAWEYCATTKASAPGCPDGGRSKPQPRSRAGGRGRPGRRSLRPKSRAWKNTKKATGRKQPQKTKTASRQPATQRGWPEECEKSNEKNKKNEGGGDRKKSPGKAKHLHFKGVGPKSGGGPEFPKSPKNEINKKSPTRPKSFFLGGPALACGGFSRRRHERPKSRA